MFDQNAPLFAICYFIDHFERKLLSFGRTFIYIRQNN